MAKQLFAPDSTNVNLAEYDSDTKELFITFKGNRRYLYKNISQYFWDNLTASTSFGHAVNTLLKDVKYERVD